MNDPKMIFGENLSIAWVNALDRCSEAPGQSLCPAIVSFKADLEPAHIELATIRHALDGHLGEKLKPSIWKTPIDTVANTIFPERTWLESQGDSERLFQEYLKMWPLLKKTPENRFGTYFKRLIAYGEKEVNQLKNIIEIWQTGIRRHSAFQAGIFDPTEDHRATPYMVFPCMQQVVFQPLGSNGCDGLAVIAFYAKQILIRKGYGNYLGLYRLGRFMASQMGLKLKYVRCIAAELDLGEGKSESEEFVNSMKREVASGKAQG